MKINMYRKVTTLISFAAFVLFLDHYVAVCFPLDAYGQRVEVGNMNPVRKRYLRSNKDFAVDSVNILAENIMKFCYFYKFRCYFSVQEGWPILLYRPKSFT